MVKSLGIKFLFQREYILNDSSKSVGRIYIYMPSSPFEMLNSFQQISYLSIFLLEIDSFNADEYIFVKEFQIRHTGKFYNLTIIFTSRGLCCL